MVSFVDAFKLPFSNFKKLAIGSLLYVVPILNILTGIFALGYVLRLTQNVVNHRVVLPDWDNLGELFMQGLKGMVITLIWFLPAVLVAFLLYFGGLTFAFMDVGYVILALAFLVITYFVPGALIALAMSSEFASGFSFRRIFNGVLTGRYFAAWLIALVVTAGLTYGSDFVSEILINIQSFNWLWAVISWIVQGVIAFVSLVISFTLYGGAWVGGNKSIRVGKQGRLRHSHRR